MIQKFMDWFERAPLYKSIWFIPLVMILYVIAVVINTFKGEK